MSLNTDQQKALTFIHDWWRADKQCMVLDGAAGCGKTFLLDQVLATLPRANPILLGPTNESVKQIREKVTGDYSFRTVHSALGIAPTTKEHELKFEQIALPSLWDNVNLAIVDECFHPDVEVLTDRGFVRFADLSELDLVASMDMSTRLVTFDKPLRYINKYYEGNLKKLVTDKILSFCVTENHNQVVINNKGQMHKKVTSLLKSTTERFYLTATSGICNDIDLTDWDKFGIAFQADGSYANWSGRKSYTDIKTGYSSSETAVQFSFTKQRKIDRLVSLLDGLKLDYITYENNGKQVFAIKRVPVHRVSKKLSEVFNLPTMSEKYAKKFIDEVMQWDGHIFKGKDILYYSSVVESNADFVQAVAVLAGFKANKSIQIDDRSSTYSDVHRVYITKNVVSGELSKIKKAIQTIPYKGNVHCVEMVKGTVITRYNGQVSVSGNCSMLSEDMLKILLQTKVKLLFAGHKSQLPPVEIKRRIFDKCVSPVFQQGFPAVSLTIPMRNTGVLWEFNNQLEENIYSGNRVIPATFDIKMKDLQELLKDETTIDNFLTDKIKVALWSNDGVDSYNKKIRSIIHGKDSDKQAYLAKDKIILTAPYSAVESLEEFSDNGLKAIGNNDTIPVLFSNTKADVLSCSEVVVKLNKLLAVPCYKIKVSCQEGEYHFYVIINPEDRKRIEEYYNHIAWSAPNKQAKERAFKQKHFIMSCFAQVKHFFAATSHRLQGTSIPNVIVIDRDIAKNMCFVEQAKSRYVACSRAMNNLYFYRGM